ncbi:MAG: LysR family transcriptional regulator [Sulfuricaulis sp.]|nr:LysR family transcriptional regulator [Sulfuricaulis sp.]
MANKHIELSLLTCLDALIAERSVTRAANRLHMSQPGMSNALARLRSLIQDPLLIRTPRGMELTPRAKELAALVKSGLSVMEEIFSDQRPFEPERADAVITIAASDSVVMLLGAALRKMLDAQAPKIILIQRPLVPDNLQQWLVEGECDLAIGHLMNMHDELHATEIFSQSWCALVGKDHPVIRTRMSLKQYVNASHVMFRSPLTATSLAESALGIALKKTGFERRMSMTVTSILMLPYVVAESNLVATLPARLARHYATFLPVRLHHLPFDAPRIMNHMVWHERTHRVGLHQWVRDLIRQIVRDIEVPTSSRRSLPTEVRHFE